MKYIISWNEKKPVENICCNSLLNAFLEVYGVYNFIIYSNDLCIIGSSWIHQNKDDFVYDLDFYHMINQFLTRKQVNKFSRLLTKTLLNFKKEDSKNA